MSNPTTHELVGKFHDKPCFKDAEDILEGDVLESRHVVTGVNLLEKTISLELEAEDNDIHRIRRKRKTRIYCLGYYEIKPRN